MRLSDTTGPVPLKSLVIINDNNCNNIVAIIVIIVAVVSIPLKQLQRCFSAAAEGCCGRLGLFASSALHPRRWSSPQEMPCPGPDPRPVVPSVQGLHRQRAEAGWESDLTLSRVFPGSSLPFAASSIDGPGNADGEAVPLAPVLKGSCCPFPPKPRQSLLSLPHEQLQLDPWVGAGINKSSGESCRGCGEAPFPPFPSQIQMLLY